MRMPWGKHRGVEMDQLPSSYLCWIIEEADNPHFLMKQEARRILGERFSRPEAPRPGGNILSLDSIRAAVGSWFRQLALRWHPDRGGSDQAMQAVNDAHERIRQILNLD